MSQQEAARKRESRLVAAATGTAVLASYAVVRSGSLVDGRLAQRISVPRGVAVDRLVGVSTDLGSVYAVMGSSAVLAGTGRRQAAADVLGAGAIAWIGAQALKPLLNRARPFEDLGSTMLVARPAGSSWPSGHTAVAASLAATLAPFLPRRGQAVAAALAGFVAFSRVYVGVHYPTDVVAGAGVGMLSARLWSRARRWIGRRWSALS